MQKQISIIQQIASTYLDLFLQSQYHILNLDMNSFYLANPFLFSKFSSFSSHLKAWDSEFSFWCQHSDSSLFFNLFRYSTQSRFKERVPSFNECSFNFSFLFDDELHVEWNAVFDLMAFLENGCECSWLCLWECWLHCWWCW